ncbi:MAG: helix-turn-helix domain-containing protein [Acidilobaceae archaeon]
MAVEWMLMESKSSTETLYKVIGAIYGNVKDFTVLDYPRNPSRRSIDVGLKLKDGRLTLLKVVDDLNYVSKAEIEELKSIASAMNAGAIIVASRVGGKELLDDMAYEKHGIKVITPETLRGLVSGKVSIYVYQSGETFKVKVNSEILRRKRLKLGLSLGNVAHAIGASRRTVYEYERGSIEPALDKAQKLVEMFGEDILVSIDVFKRVKHSEAMRIKPDLDCENIILKTLSQTGFRVAHAKKTTFDIVGNRGGVKISLVIRHGRESIDSIINKYINSKRLSRVAETKNYTVIDDNDILRLLKKEDIEAYTTREIIDIIKRELKES